MRYIGVTLLAVLVLGGTAWGWMAWNERIDSAPESSTAVDPAPTDATPVAEPTPARVALELPADPSVVVLGDSWSAGFAAEPSSKGFVYVAADRLGWDVRVIADGSGTGYVDSGPDEAGTYAQRLAEQPVDRSVDLLVVQGGLNDEGEAPTEVGRAAAEVLDIAARKYPKAEVLMMGPISPFGTVPDSIWSIDTVLSRIAAENRVAYLSPQGDDWWDGRPERYIDEDAAMHPSTKGHAYLADRFADAVSALS